MEGKLDFSLPEKKQKKTFASVIIVLLLLVLTGFAAVNMFLLLKDNEQRPAVVHSFMSAQQTKELAGKLAQRNLFVCAADVWQEYLSRAELADAERARILYQVGTLFQQANQYDRAIEYYYRSESTAKLSELEPQINSRIKECFEKLGKFSALRYELMDRTSIDSNSMAGGKIVAEIGAQKITESDLDAIIEDEIDNQLEPVSSFMTTEQLNEQKNKMLAQYREPANKQKFLQSWLAQEVLYRQALEEELAQKPQVKELVDKQIRDVLSQFMMNRELASKINITETDLQTYYKANKDEFIEPATAQISHILVDDQQQAKDLIGRINNGEDFASLAKQFSIDEETKQSGGKIDAEITKGTYVAGVGDNVELNNMIFAADGPKVLDEPFKTEKGWEIIKVESINPDRRKSMDEVRQQVMLMLMNQKSQDVQRDYIGRLMDEYNVIIHNSEFGDSSETEVGAVK